jgi:tetratricopeptide (TPR) repeat protein
MRIRHGGRAAARVCTSLLAGALSVTLAFAASDTGREKFPPDSPPYPYPNQKGKQDQKGAQKKKKEQRSQQELREQYDRARALIKDGQYEAGIAAMLALDHDDNPEVANFIGYASRKLGRYEDSKQWYERALAADPNHVRTWSYYGAWHAEQGNRLMAQDYLEKVRLICGNTECEEYTLLKGVIEGTATY